MAIAKKSYESVFFKGRQWERPVTCPSCAGPAEKVDGAYRCTDLGCTFNTGYRIEPAKTQADGAIFLRAVPRKADRLTPDWSASVPWPREEAP